MIIIREELPSTVNIYMEKNTETGQGFVLVNKNLPEKVQEQLLKECLVKYKEKYNEDF